MFTGIVQGTGVVRKIGGLADRSKSISIDMDHLAVSLQLGASVAINGVCLSVTDISGSTVAFDTVRQTLQLSNLGTAQVGDSVNVERSLRVGDEIGGHNLSGHIAGTVEIVDVDEWGSERRLRFGCAEEHMSYLFDKGFVALDGVSLTIADVDRDGQSISVNLIPDTLRRTVFAGRKVGDRVNLEIDSLTRTVVETVRQFLRSSDRIDSD